MRCVSRNPQCGAAIIMALLLTALLGTVATLMLSGLDQWFRHFTYEREQTQAKSLAHTAVRLTAQFMGDELRLGPVDHLGELWAQGLPETAVEGGKIEGALVDLQGRFNLNNLALDGVPSAPDVALIKKLLAELSIAPTLIDQWLESTPRVDGRLPSINHWADFAKTLPAPALTKLAPHCVVLSGRTALNVNTATPELTRALLGTEANVAARWLATRVAQPATQIETWRNAYPTPAGITLGVGSEHFEMNVTTRFGDGLARANAVLHRPRSANPVSRQYPAAQVRSMLLQMGPG